MTPKQISDLIRDTSFEVIENCVYLRATNPEANISADEIDLEGKVFCLYNNRPVIDGTAAQENGLTVETIPVEILILCLADFDDNDIDSDEIMDPLYGYAQNIFDKISNSGALPEYVEDYTIELGTTTRKIYDKVMTGVRLSFNLLNYRGQCQ